MTVTGDGRLLHAYLPANARRRLSELAGAAPQHWGLLFVLDGRGREWTLYSPDPDYTAMFAPVAHTLDLELPVFAAKFPAWNRGWRTT